MVSAVEMIAVFRQALELLPGGASNQHVEGKIAGLVEREDAVDAIGLADVTDRRPAAPGLDPQIGRRLVGRLVDLRRDDGPAHDKPRIVAATDCPIIPCSPTGICAKRSEK